MLSPWFSDYLRYVRTFMPLAFLVENVDGIESL